MLMLRHILGLSWKLEQVHIQCGLNAFAQKKYHIENYWKNLNILNVQHIKINFEKSK